MTRARRPGWQRVVATVVLTLLTLAAARAIVAAKPSQAELVRPFIETGAIGDTVEARTFSVRVLGVRGAPTVLTSPYVYVGTGGVFIAVKVRVVAHREPMNLIYVRVNAAGSVAYEPTTKVSQPMAARTYQPDVPIEGEFVFEVPKPVATSLTVRFSEAHWSRPEMATFAEIPLPITQDRLATWLAVSEPMAPDKPAVVA